MPIKAYVGQPRSGKSYEVVSNVILNGLRDGRRIISNIAGLNYEAMKEILIKEGIPEEKIGTIIAVTEKQVNDPHFWMTDTDREKGIESFLQPGDLLALDEIWRFWKKRGEIDPRALNFFRMHGHFPHPETGLICEIALISQVVTDINENIRGVIQETFKTTKLTALGLTKRYSVTVFAGGNTTKANKITQYQCKYDDKYFPLYKSHSQQTGASAVEKNIDDRGNILKGGFFKLWLPFMFILFCLAGMYLWKYFHPEQKKTETQVTQSGENQAGTGQAGQAVTTSASMISDEWRLAGVFQKPNGDIVVMLDDGNKKFRYLVNPPYLNQRGWQLNVQLPDSSYATNYSGKVPDQSRMMPK